MFLHEKPILKPSPIDSRPLKTVYKKKLTVLCEKTGSNRRFSKRIAVDHFINFYAFWSSLGIFLTPDSDFSRKTTPRKVFSMKILKKENKCKRFQISLWCKKIRSPSGIEPFPCGLKAKALPLGHLLGKIFKLSLKRAIAE